MSSSFLPSEKILVCQRGSRHRYAIPRMLEEEGRLAALYADSTTLSPLGKFAGALCRWGVAPPSVKALASRIPHGISHERIFSSDALVFSKYLFGRKFKDLSGVYIKWGLQDAGVVYSMYGEEPDFLLWAKKRGAKIVVDVFVHPLTDQIVEDEACRLFPEKERDQQWINDVAAHSAATFELADMLLCPSAWVAGGVRSMSPEHEHKIRVVPYGSSLKIRNKPVAYPQKGRILFAGRDPLRKGLHYLAAAAEVARRNGFDLEVRVAGVSSYEVEWMTCRDQLHFLGDLPMDEMVREYETADVFVLPSLSEGQAGVILEAMSHGCPVIATKECGIDFQEGCGVVVPSCDEVALAEMICRVVGDRSMRSCLAEGALRQARFFTEDAWKNRLLSVLFEEQY